jgi:glucose/arabinose dehydrogenase
MSFRLLPVLVFLGLAIPGRAALVGAGAGFSETPFIISGASQTTDMEWAPDTTRRLFLAQKDGTVRVMFPNGVFLPAPVLTLNQVYTESECGLVGLCFDPNFLVNHYLYLFVTVSASEQQILRCQEQENGTFTVSTLVPGLPTMGANHDGGGLAVGLDGKLYFSIGDLGTGVGVNANLTSLASKVGRCNLDGTEVLLNPFHDGPGATNDFIWARGFRNPFKMAVQPNSGLIWVNVAGNNYEQIFAVDKGDHAGWNTYENNQPAGFITPRIKYKTNGTDTRQITPGGGYWHENVITFTTTAAHGFRKGERVSVSGVLDPSFNGNYFIIGVPSATDFQVSKVGPHVVSGGGSVTTFNLGGAVTGGCFYNATGFPDMYRQNYFFCDYNSGRVNRVQFDSTNDVAAVQYFVDGVNGATDVSTGPHGHLYYAGFGSETVYRLMHTNNPQRIAVSPEYLNMAEGGVAVVDVRLTSAPASDVILNVAWSSGSADISTTNLSLLFTPEDFNIQPIFIEAAPDADRAHSRAVFTLSCPGYPPRQVFVNAYDPDHGALSFASVVRTNNGTRFQVATERRTRVALEASSNLLTWQPFSTNLSVTNTATLFDNSAPLSQRFYRARVVR